MIPKKISKQKLFILIFLFIIFIFNMAPVANTIPDNNDHRCNYTRRHKIRIKVMIVNSYQTIHPCTSPQVRGIKEGLTNRDIIDYDIEAIDLYTKTKNIKPLDMQIIANKAIADINKFNPDIIFTTDDNACRLVGIPLSTKYTVISTGLNKPPRQYIEEYCLTPKKNHIIFISEYILLNDIWLIFRNNNYLVTTAYIITETNKNMSTTNYYMLQNYLSELKAHDIDIKLIKVSTLQGFINAIKKLQSSMYEEGLIVPVIQRLYDTKDGKYKDKMYVIKTLIKYNRKHLELAGNLQFCRFGISMCNIPSFYEMGRLGGNIGSRFVLRKIGCGNNRPLPQFCTIFKPSNVIAINKERLKQLDKLYVVKKTDNIIRYDKITPFNFKLYEMR